MQGNLHKLLTEAKGIKKISKGLYAPDKFQIADQAWLLAHPPPVATKRTALRVASDAVATAR
jgi:hypothetical protein